MKPVDRTDPVEGSPIAACQAAPDLMKVLILGGYGVFGGRLARLLLQDGIEVIVAGRDAAKAAAFTRQYGGSPLFIGIAKDLSPIAEAAPALVVDAAGPFQAYRGDPYRVARFCIGRKINYLDFSDDATFTVGISALNEAAIEARLFRAIRCFERSGDFGQRGACAQARGCPPSS